MKETEQLTRHQVLLYEGDFERLQRMTRGGNATKIIRDLVRRHIITVENLVARKDQQ